MNCAHAYAATAGPSWRPDRASCLRLRLALITPVTATAGCREASPHEATAWRNRAIDESDSSASLIQVSEV